MENIKTIGLLTLLTILFVWIGGIFGGKMGMIIAFIIAIGMNFFSYFFSDKMVLKHYEAIEVTRKDASGLFEIVERLTNKANLPMPKVYIIPDSVPNAFATGRDHHHAVVAITEGLLEILDVDEVEAVIAHELSHIRHYDMLIGTIAATIAGAISMIANFGMLFGSSNSEERPNPIMMIVLSILLPIAAMIIQMSISRSREYKADEGAAYMTGHPEWLQSALIKLENYASKESVHLFIVNPFSGKDFSFQNLFQTHPSTKERVEKLEELKRHMN